MVGNMGFSGLILIVIVALIFFGPSKLPQLGRAVGDTLREFRSSTKGVLDDAAEDAKADKASEQHKK